jgi:hypothetical protein
LFTACYGRSLGVQVLIGIAAALLVTWLLLIAALAIRRPKTLQLEAAYRRFSPSNALPGPNRKLRLTLLVLTALVILNVVWLTLVLSEASGEGGVESSSTQSKNRDEASSSDGRSAASEPPSRSVEGRETIQLEDLADSAKPFQAVRIQGSYRADALLRVQRWQDGKWLAFPVPTKTDKSGRFTTYVQLDQPGQYRLRMLDASSGVTSKTFLLVIEG